MKLCVWLATRLYTPLCSTLHHSTHFSRLCSGCVSLTITIILMLCFTLPIYLCVRDTHIRSWLISARSDKGAHQRLQLHRPTTTDIDWDWLRYYRLQRYVQIFTLLSGGIWGETTGLASSQTIWSRPEDTRGGNNWCGCGFFHSNSLPLLWIFCIATLEMFLLLSPIGPKRRRRPQSPERPSGRSAQGVTGS